MGSEFISDINRPVRKACLAWQMRLPAFLLLLLCISFGHVKAQQISLSEKDASLDKVLKKIQQQSGFTCLYTSQQLNQAKKVTIEIKNVPLKPALDQVFAGQPMTYVIDEKTIVVHELQATQATTTPAPLVGFVTNENGAGMLGATVVIPGTGMSTLTDIDGHFQFAEAPASGRMLISFIGYKTDTINIRGRRSFSVQLLPTVSSIREVSVVSNGYQELPKERSNGSFEVISSKQLQHSVDPNVLSRLEGITTSIDFRNDLRPVNSSNPLASRSPLANLTIRGKNTLNDAVSADLNGNFSGQVLVVIDGIASPYSIDQINPNDVESITLLKDAGAASIWGSRAANGVIVIKTKKGSYNRKLRVSFNSDVNVTNKVDLFYNKTMSVSDFIDAEKLKFVNDNRSLPAVNLSSLYQQDPRSPVVELMNAWMFDKTMTEAEANAQIDLLRRNDIRNDYTKYFLQNAVTQSYSVAVDGGTDRSNDRLAAAYDRRLNNTKNSNYDRFTLRYAKSLKITQQLELSGNISYSSQNNKEQAPENRITGATDKVFSPYSRLKDDAGHNLALTKTYRPGFVNLLASTYGNKYRSLSYVPMDDINEGYDNTRLQNLNINLGLQYRIANGISAQVTYNYNTGRNDENTLYREGSFYMRNLINYFTTSPASVNPMTGDPVTPFVQQLPSGGQFTTTATHSNNNTLRGQLNLDKTWNQKHQVSAIAGMDITQTESTTQTDGFYGYDESTRRSDNKLDYKTMLPIFFSEDFNGYNGEYIPNLNVGFTDIRVRTLSAYGNAAYTYDRRYTLSASVRKDLSSEFGQGTNQHGTPYFSVGGGWNINEESWYKPKIFSQLKLRTTFGYNGNVNPTVLARPLINYSQAIGFPNGPNNLPYAYTDYGTGVTNSKLRPERTGMFNIGTDFEVTGGRLSGSIDYYRKSTTDLISNGALDPSTGYTNINYNTGDLRGKGIDFRLNSTNIQRGAFKWNSTFLFSYNRVKVTKLYASEASMAGAVVTNNAGSYNVGYDLARIFGYKWAGLDPATGDPRGLLNGATVTVGNNPDGLANYNAINAAPVASAKFFGSAVPVYYGSFRNTLTYGQFSVSANLMYKFGYYIRRPKPQVVSYSSLFSTTAALQGIEYASRWQHPGDESHTNVPSIALSGTDQHRDDFYYYSEINVIKGDHIRLQEVNCNYTLQTKAKWRIKNPTFYFNVNNLGLLWKANKQGVDPEVFDYPNPKSYSLGLSANF